MDDKLFADLLQSAAEMRDIEQGKSQAAAVRVYPRPDPRQLRRRLHLTQAEFARAIGVSTALVQSWEQQRRIPEGAPLKILCVLDKQPELLAHFQAA